MKIKHLFRTAFWICSAAPGQPGVDIYFFQICRNAIVALPSEVGVHSSQFYCYLIHQTNLQGTVCLPMKEFVFSHRMYCHFFHSVFVGSRQAHGIMYHGTGYLLVKVPLIQGMNDTVPILF